MPEIPFALQWSILEDELLPLKDSVNGFLLSEKITNIPEFEYYLKIFPNGNNDENIGKTWIYLWLKFKNVKKVEVDYTITNESANYSKTGHIIYEKSKGKGCLGCDTEEFFDPEKKYIVDGKCIVKMYGVFKFHVDDTLFAENVRQKWEGGELGDILWKRDDTKDFTIFSEEKEIEVHKFILNNLSEVFTAMLKSNMKEANEDKMVIIDFSFNVVETAFKIIYCCNFTSTLSLDELMSLLQFFDKYQLPSFKAKVEPYLIDQISASNVCNLTNASILTNSFKLKEKCFEFLSASFKQQTPIHDIDALNKDIIVEIVKNSLYKNVQTEK